MEALKRTDPELYEIIEREERYQRSSIRLIPSENYTSQAVLEASGSVLQNKYSEGYAGKRYYEGQRYIDRVERLAVTRAEELFGAEHANVQPYSGSPANFAVYCALLEPGDTILGMALAHGGHLTHGSDVSMTGRFWNPVRYGVRKETGRIDMDEVRQIARAHRPKMLVAGASAYPRELDFAAFGEIAHEVGAHFLADISHIAGLVVAGVHPSPLPHADVVMTTTHKTLRGPRGAMILCGADLAAAIDKAVFPGLQGGPHNHTTAAIAVALKEAASEEFREYGRQTVRNAQALAQHLLEHGYDLVSGGTDNHLLLIDLTNRGILGKKAAKALDRAGIICNANAVPFDPRPAFSPSGIRLGTPSVTSRGMKEAEMQQIAAWMNRVLQDVENEDLQKAISAEVREFCRAFPAPGLAE